MEKNTRKSGNTKSGNTTKYTAHHTVLAKTYGTLADLRRELSDSKATVAERTEILKIFADCSDSQRAWLLMEDYFERLSLSRKDFSAQDWWPRLMAAHGKKRLEETAILFLRANIPVPTELQPPRQLGALLRDRTGRTGTNPGQSARTMALSSSAVAFGLASRQSARHLQSKTG